MKIVIAGGSGFLGRVLCRHFGEQGHDIICLTRGTRSKNGWGQSVAWDGKSMGPWATQLDGADVLINLCGKSVDCRYTDANKQAIYNSRLQSTKVLGEAISVCANPPGLWLNASSATIYRHAEDRDMDEETGEPGEGFSVDVCQRWERTFFEAPVPESVRRVALRTAIVLGRQGGALVPLRMLARCGLGGRQGDGRQFMSWLHEADFAGIVDFIIAHEEIRGVVNVAAPRPVPNTEFMATLRGSCNVPVGVPLPVWLLQVGAVLIRTETELILKSRRAVPRRLQEAGYRFQFKRLEEALADLATD